MITALQIQPDGSSEVVATYPDNTDVGTIRNDHPEATSIESRPEGESINTVLWETTQ